MVLEPRGIGNRYWLPQEAGEVPCELCAKPNARRAVMMTRSGTPHACSPHCANILDHPKYTELRQRIVDAFEGVSEKGPFRIVVGPGHTDGSHDVVVSRIQTLRLSAGLIYNITHDVNVHPDRRLALLAFLLSGFPGAFE